MLSRTTYDGPVSFYAGMSEVVALVAIGATGDPTLLTKRSRGVVAITRKSTGVYNIQFGASVNGTTQYDRHVALDDWDFTPDLIALGTAVTSGVNGRGALLRNDLGTGFNLPAPVKGTPTTETSGGSLTDSTTYYAVVTALDSNGNESLASGEMSQATGNSGTNVNTITWKWTAVPGAASYRVYTGTATGAQTIVHTVAGATTAQYVDTGAATAASAGDPAIQARPPVAKASLTIQLLTDAGAAADPTQLARIRFRFRFIETTAG